MAIKRKGDKVTVTACPFCGTPRDEMIRNFAEHLEDRCEEAPEETGGNLGP